MNHSHFFGQGGTIHATLPGTVQEPSQTSKKPRDVFALPHLNQEQMSTKRIRLLSDQVVSVKDASSEAFLAWYLAQLRAISASNNSFGHSKLWLLDGIDVSSIGIDEKWYLLEEMMHLPRYANSGVRLFVEDEQTGAA